MRNQGNDDSHGSARFAEPGEIKASQLTNGQGPVMGECPHTGSDLSLGANTAITTVAGAGSGKGRDVLQKMLMTYPGSVLVNDPKGEQAAGTVFNQINMGKKAYCINPCALHTSAPWFMSRHRVNPLDILTADSPTLTADIQVIMEMLIQSTPNAGGNTPFFEQKARHWCGAILHWLVLNYGSVTLPTLYSIINIIETDPVLWDQIIQTKLLLSPVESIRNTGAEMRNKRATAGAGGEFSGIMSTINNNLNFLSDSGLSDCLSGSDFSLKNLTEENINVYLMVPPEYVSLWSSFLRVIIGVAMLYKQRAPGTSPVLFMIDEAAQLGHFEMLERAYTLGQGYGIRTWGVFQDIGQIIRHYGEAGPQTFLGSSQIRQVFGVRDYETAELISNMLGTQTVSYANTMQQAESIRAKKHIINSLLSGSDPFAAAVEYKHYQQSSSYEEKRSKPLMAPEEIMQMPEQQQILFISGINCPPILANKTPYYQQKQLAGCYLPNPYYPPFDRITVPGLLRGNRFLTIRTEPVPDQLMHWPQYQQGIRAVIEK